MVRRFRTRSADGVASLLKQRTRGRISVEFSALIKDDILVLTRRTRIVFGKEFGKPIEWSSF